MDIIIFLFFLVCLPYILGGIMSIIVAILPFAVVCLIIGLIIVSSENKK